MSYGRGVVVGKFLPPHRGHKLLIDTACARAERVTVIVCGKPSDPIPGEQRQAWLQEIHPTANVLLIDDRYDANDTLVWAHNTIEWLGGPPDVVFTSEDYGQPFAAAMGCVHVSVDRERTQVPCSGSAIRQDPFTHWECLEPPVRAWYALRVCLVGAESTGTTTLASDLAAHYASVWVPEYGREYSVLKQQRGETEWTSEEFVWIAQEQNRLEDALARTANRVLFCDTNSLATALWHRRYLGSDSAAVRAVAASQRYSLYLLTGDEIPFVQDGLRDGEHIRHAMHQWFVDELAGQATPWILLRGSWYERLSLAIQAVDRLLGRSPALHRPN